MCKDNSYALIVNIPDYMCRFIKSLLLAVISCTCSHLAGIVNVLTKQLLLYYNEYETVTLHHHGITIYVCMLTVIYTTQQCFLSNHYSLQPHSIILEMFFVC